jgi:hypothetical protein
MGCAKSTPSNTNNKAPGSKETNNKAGNQAGAGGGQQQSVPPDLPPEQVVRIVLKETLLSLKPKAAKAVTSAPGKEIDANDWQKCAVKVEEGADSLILHYTMAHYKGAIALAQWGKSSQTVFLEVGDLPAIVHRTETKVVPDGEDPSEGATGENDNLKSTHSFIVSWKEKEGGATNRLIFGCKDEMQCDSWKTSIRQYCNIKTRVLFNYLWKLNSDVELSSCSESNIPKALQDLSNWRYRLFSLHEQKKEGNYCMTYVSEKNGAEFSIACVLLTNDSEPVKAKITVLPQIQLDPIGKSEEDRFKTSVEQYRVASGYHTQPEPLPTQFHAFMVEWNDEEEGMKRVVIGSAGKPMCTKWNDAIDNIQKDK